MVERFHFDNCNFVDVENLDEVLEGNKEEEIPNK